MSLSFERISFLSYDLFNETLENTKLSAVSWSHSSFKDSKKPKTPKKSSYFWRSPDVSVLYEFFCNSPNSHNLKQIKIYHYKNNPELFLPLAFSKYDESIISSTCFSSIFSSHFFDLPFTAVGSETLSISFSSKRPV